MANAAYMARKAFEHPTAWGREHLRERLIDAAYASVSQIVVGLYKEHGEQIAYSGGGVRGTIERLYDCEKDPRVKAYFEPYVRRMAKQGSGSAT